MGILIQIADRHQPRLKRALIAAFHAMRGRLPFDELTRRIETLDFDGVIRMLNGAEDDLGPFVTELQNAIRESGMATVRMIPGVAMLNSAHTFDLLHAHTTGFIQQYQLNLIQQISNETRKAIRQGLMATVNTGQNPVTTARQIRQSLGLTTRQELAVRNYRKALEDLDSDALRRALRDKRFDRTFERAIQSGRGLTKTQVNKMVKRYRERFIKFRSETIARTEALRATSVGNRASMQQMLADGAIDRERVRRQWVYTHDSRTRAAHRSVPRLNEGGITLDGSYRTEEGPLAYPRDPNGSAENTIRCRCTERYFVPEVPV